MRRALAGRECSRSKDQVRFKLEELVKTEEGWVRQGRGIARVVVCDAGESQAREQAKQKEATDKYLPGWSVPDRFSAGFRHLDS
jgi:hypothetical protein